MKLSLRKYDPASCKPFNTHILVGKRGSGKSVLLRNLLYEHRGMHDVGVCCTPTMETADMFREFVPEGLIYNDYNGPVLQRIIAQQRARQEAGKKAPRVFIVLDDCGYEKELFSSKNTAMRDLFQNGRHYKCTVYICLQYCTTIPPSFRANTDVVYALREPIIGNQKRLHEFFFGVIETFQNFRRVFGAATENHECLVTINTASSNSIDDCVFWYKARLDVPRFRLCAPKYWRINTRYCRTPQEMRELRLRNSLDEAKRNPGAGTIEVVEKA